jgi:acyl-CoA synthetase (AMP-forming)/AMP-acid ligase II
MRHDALLAQDLIHRTSKLAGVFGDVGMGPALLAQDLIHRTRQALGVFKLAHKIAILVPNSIAFFAANWAGWAAADCRVGGP